jgi:hypothetical protein
MSAILRVDDAVEQACEGSCVLRNRIMRALSA